MPRRIDGVTLKRHDGRMKATQKRATAYFDASLHRALRIKAAVTERSLSEIVNAVVRQSMAEDAEDLAAFKERAEEPDKSGLRSGAESSTPPGGLPVMPPAGTRPSTNLDIADCRLPVFDCNALSS